jgi:outer membrane immunogenic protein
MTRLPFAALGCAVAGSIIFAAPSMADYSYPPIWSGLYVGGNVGYGAGDADFSVNPTGAWNAFPAQAASVRSTTDGSLKPDGVIAGVQAGFNEQYGIWVVGIEADISGADQSSSRTGGPVPGTGVTTFSQQADLSWLATLRGRLGVAAGPALFYATAGAAVGEWDIYMRMAGGGDAAVFNRSSVRTGWTVGGGAELAISEHLSLKGEYLFADFGSTTGESIFLPSAPGFLNEHTVDMTTQIGRAGINYRF